MPLPKFSWRHLIRLELWLALPLLGFGFWLVSGWATQQLLNQSNDQALVLQSRPQKSTPQRVISIRVTLDPDQKVSQVKVKSATTALTELEFELPTIESAPVEAAIGNRLNLSVAQVKNLIHYQSHEQKHGKKQKESG